MVRIQGKTIPHPLLVQCELYFHGYGGNQYEVPHRLKIEQAYELAVKHCRAYIIPHTQTKSLPIRVYCSIFHSDKKMDSALLSVLG